MRAIIVDDEKHCREVLEHLLVNYCPEVNILANFADGSSALEGLKLLTPDILFLDIEMPGMNGFALLEKYQNPEVEVIFTTAYNEYAIKAIRHSALDYLLKPIDKDELKSAVTRAKEHRLKSPGDRVKDLLELLQKKKPAKRFAASTMEGLIMVNTEDILYCESDSAYCKLVFVDGKSMMLSKTLKEVEDLLRHDEFCRIHNSYLVNLNYVNRYIKGEGGEVVMKSGASLPVSRTRKKDFINMLEKL